MGGVVIRLYIYTDIPVFGINAVVISLKRAPSHSVGAPLTSMA